MKNINNEMKLFQSFLKLIAEQFGNNTEITLHDWSKGYEHSIVAIENAHITKRKIGDCGSNLGLEVLRGTSGSDMRCNYVTRTQDGRMLRSSTMYIKDDNGKALGALCINTDISDFLSMQHTVESMLPKELNPKTSDEFFATDVGELLSYLIGEGLQIVNKPIADMSKEDKLTVLQFLDERGALLISKSGPKICQTLEISKFTLYNYLDEIRSKQTDTDQ